MVGPASHIGEAVDRFVALGGNVYYDYQSSVDSTGRMTVDPKAAHPHSLGVRLVIEQLFPRDVVSVDLRDTKADDDDARLLGRLPAVEHVGLAKTNITDEALATVGRLSGLRSLSLIETRITDRGMAHLEPLELESLSLWKTDVTDRGVKHLRNMKSLRNLVLDETRITNACLEDVGRLTNLEEWLGLTQTQITDDGLHHLTRLKKLQNLNLIGTNVSNDGLRKLRKALPKANISPFSP